MLVGKPSSVASYPPERSQSLSARRSACSRRIINEKHVGSRDLYFRK
jgi:hypothetical protein